MRYPNLLLALSETRIPQYQLTSVLTMSQASISRRFVGMADFTETEKQRISKFLGFELDWLFEEASIPSSARTGKRPTVAARLHWEDADGNQIPARTVPL